MVCPYPSELSKRALRDVKDLYVAKLKLCARTEKIQISVYVREFSKQGDDFHGLLRTHVILIEITKTAFFCSPLIAEGKNETENVSLDRCVSVLVSDSNRL